MAVATHPRRRETSAVRRMAAIVVVLVALATATAVPAGAGGTHMSPVKDRYEPGEVATLVGYTSGGQLGWVQDGPFYAYLVAGEAYLWSDHRLPAGSVPLGPLSLEKKGRTLRVSLSFPVPHDLAPGLYTVTYCNDPCTTGLGDLLGGSLAVSVDPPWTVQREWPLDDPEIANLADDAVLTGPGDAVTAGDVRAGRLAPPPGRRGPGSAPPLGPSERPAPPWAEPRLPVAPATSAAVPAPADEVAAPARPVDSGDPQWAVALVLLVVSVVAGGAWLRRGRGLTRRPAPGSRRGLGTGPVWP